VRQHGEKPDLLEGKARLGAVYPAIEEMLHKSVLLPVNVHKLETLEHKPFITHAFMCHDS
jgi:hypothetical protein